MANKRAAAPRGDHADHPLADPGTEPSGGRARAGHATPPGPPRLDNARHLPVTEIDLNPQQARQEINEDTLSELAESVRQYGVLEPILVRPVGEHYEIVAGERRYRAAVLAGHHTIPALIRDDLPDDEAAWITATENLQREDLSYGDEARQYQRLLDLSGLSQVKLGERLGVNYNRISRLVRLLQQAPHLLEQIDGGTVTLREALDQIADKTDPCHGDKKTTDASSENAQPERVTRAEVADPLADRVVRPVPAAFKPVQRFARAVAKLQPAAVPPDHREELASQLEAAARDATLAALALRQATQAKGPAD